MPTATDHVLAAPGREGKKQRTRRDLSAAARDLTFEHGPDAVTIQQIAERADVSTRTFFNYFSCKEEAVVGVDPTLVAELAARVHARPAEESPLVALTTVLLENAADPEVAEGWVRRTELVERYPSLLPRHLTAMAEVEDALVAAIADRMGTSAARDPYPTIIVASTVAVMRSTFAWWMSSDRRQSLPSVLATGFRAVAAGFSPTLQDHR